MKRIVSILSCALLLSTAVSCDWFELDNQEGWNAKVQGKIIDVKTGQPVQSEQGNSIVIVEKGWDAEANQTWRIKNDGTYRNDLVFAGEYRMNTVSSANFIADPVDFTLQKGDNTVDFKVTPFCRIVNPTVTFDSAAKKIKASFKIETDLPEVNNIGNVYLCVYPDRFVRQGYNNCREDDGAKLSDVDPTKGETITLEVDMNNPKNAEEFQYDRPHFIRIAAIGGHYTGGKLDNTFNQGYYNYSPVYRLENGVVTEVTDW